jgi:hypothetical protein
MGRSAHRGQLAKNKRLLNTGQQACDIQNLGHHRAHAVVLPILFASHKHVAALPWLAFAS